MPFNELIVYIAFVVGFAITPGPNMMLYLTYTFEYGRKAGWATAAGIVSSFVIHLSAIVFGLTAILTARPGLLDLLRYCGIAYLLYLAFSNLKQAEWKSSAEKDNKEGLNDFFVKGLITNILNPGSLVLYFSLIPQFIHPEKGHLMTQNLLLGVLQMSFSFFTNCTIIYFAGFATSTFFKNERYQQRVRYVMSILIVVFALQLLFFRMK